MRLVTYSWLVVVVAVACAAITWLGIAGWMAAVVVIASLAAHVAGNALGTKMREAADLELSRRPAPRMQAAPMPTPQPTHLERSGSLGRLVPVSAVIGGLCGGLIGTSALVAFTTCSWAGAVIGGISSALIGGLFGFLGASFVEILRTSVREAIASERRAAAADRRR